MPTTEEMMKRYFGPELTWKYHAHDRSTIPMTWEEVLGATSYQVIASMQVPEPIWEEAVYKVGDVIPSSALLDEETAQTLPPGTVLVEGSSWKVRIIADLEANDSYVFKDRLGWYGVDEFHIVHIPEPVDEVNELADNLRQIYTKDGLNFIENGHRVEEWREMAQYVLDNYEPKN